MRLLWLLLLPALFLPDLGTRAVTNIGSGEFSDFLIGPYIVLTYLAGRNVVRGEWLRQPGLLLAFAGWALVSSLTINLRYGYAGLDYVQFSLVKVGKLFTYGLAGVLTIRAIERDRAARVLFPWAMLAVCAVMAVSLMLLRDSDVPRDEARVGFGSSNGVSVAMAITCCWMVAYALSSHSSRAWCITLGCAAPALLVGFFFSDGRGGWVAALVGGAYIALRFGVRPVLAGAVLVVSLTGVATYQTEAGFRKQVDMTLDPTRLTEQSEFARSTGVDDGVRMEIWKHEAPKLLDAPLLGTGLFHRAGYSGLWTTGSHNFWIQMFLETGVVGGVLALMIMKKWWHTAGTRWPEAAGVGIPGRAALVAAFLGGMSGEYFYGGKILLVLFLVVAPALSLPLELRRQVVAQGAAQRKLTYRTRTA